MPLAELSSGCAQQWKSKSFYWLPVPIVLIRLNSHNRQTVDEFSVHFFFFFLKKNVLMKIYFAETWMSETVTSVDGTDQSRSITGCTPRSAFIWETLIMRSIIRMCWVFHYTLFSRLSRRQRPSFCRATSELWPAPCHLQWVCLSFSNISAFYFNFTQFSLQRFRKREQR